MNNEGKLIWESWRLLLSLLGGGVGRFLCETKLQFKLSWGFDKNEKKKDLGLQCKTLLRLKIWSKLYKVRFIVTLGPYWNPSKLQFLLVLTKKQDFSLKCLAWKGFIPCLRWKSPVSKSPKNYWSKKKSWVWKNYGFKMNFHFKCLCTSFLKFIALYFSYQSEHMYVFHLSKSVYFLM